MKIGRTFGRVGVVMACVLSVAVLGAWVGRAGIALGEPKADSGDMKKDKDKDAKDGPKEPAAPRVKTVRQLEREMDEAEGMLERENHRHERQLTILRGAMAKQVSVGGGKNADDSFTQALQDEKARHEDRVKEIGEQWLQIKSELDAAKAAAEEKK